MAIYDPDAPPERQEANWNCSCASAAWALQSLGFDKSEQEVTSEMLARGLVTPEWGLMDGSGAGLAQYVRDVTGLPVVNRWLTWADINAASGYGPICQGSNSMYHWSAIRYVEDEIVRMMNPAPGWMGVGDELTHYGWESWGPWAGVFINAGDDPVTNAELEAENAALQQQVSELNAQLATERSWGSSVLTDTCQPVLAMLDKSLVGQQPADWPTVQSARNTLKTNLNL